MTYAISIFQNTEYLTKEGICLIDTKIIIKKGSAIKITQFGQINKLESFLNPTIFYALKYGDYSLNNLRQGIQIQWLYEPDHTLGLIHELDI